MKCFSAVGIGRARPGSACPGAGISGDFLNMNIADLPLLLRQYNNWAPASQRPPHHKFDNVSRRAQKTAGTFVPAEHIATKRPLLEAGAPPLRDRVVGRAGAAADADRADDMAIDDQRIAAARRNHVIEGGEIVEERSLADQALEHHGRPTLA